MELSKNLVIKVYTYEELPSHFLEGKEENLFYSPAWFSVLRSQYDCTFYATADSVTGELMFFAFIKCLGGKKFSSLPFSDYTRPYIYSVHAMQAHIQVLQQMFPEFPVCVKLNLPEDAEKWVSSLKKPTLSGVLHRVSTSSAVQLEKQMSRSFRRGARRAPSRGLVFGTSCSRHSLEAFYTLFYELRMQKHGLIPQPFSFFEKVFDEFISRNKGFIAEVRKEGKLLSSAIILQQQHGLYYKWGCSSQKNLIDRPNNLLFCELLHLGQRDGYEFVDLGLSDQKVNKGLMRFKESMGGVESPIYTFQFFPEGYPSVAEAQIKAIVNSMARIVVDNRFDRKTTEEFSQTLYPLFV